MAQIRVTDRDYLPLGIGDIGVKITTMDAKTVTDAQFNASDDISRFIDEGILAVVDPPDTIATSGAVGTDAITRAKLADNAVSTAELATGAVTSVKIASGAVVKSKLGAAAVSTTQIATGAVTSNKIAAGAVVLSKIGSGAVSTTALATGAVTSSKLAAGAVVASKCTSIKARTIVSNPTINSTAGTLMELAAQASGSLFIKKTATGNDKNWVAIGP